MRFASVVAVLTASLGCALTASAWNTPASSVTVVLDFKGARSPYSIREMQRESGQILKATGVSLEWKLRGEASTQSFSDLVVMTFRGSCTADGPAAPSYDELGPFAITRTVNGEVQPFGEVDCDRVVNSAKSAMLGEDYVRADALIGRALGRVVAHELVHMLTKSGAHSHEGVQKPALSGRQLISASLPLSAFDVDRLRQERQVQVRQPFESDPSR